MNNILCNEFTELESKDLYEIDGGFKIFGCSVGGLVCGTLAGAAVSKVVGGYWGLAAGAVTCAGVTYLYDHA